MTDLQTREDLVVLFDTFYQRLLEHPEMHRIFIDVKEMDMQKHLPEIVSFWEQVVFNTGDYRRNVMALHLDLNQITHLDKPLFDFWLKTLFETVDFLFSGEKSELLKTRALSIATVMQIKIQNSSH